MQLLKRGATSQNLPPSSSPKQRGTTFDETGLELCGWVQGDSGTGRQGNLDSLLALESTSRVCTMQQFDVKIAVALDVCRPAKRVGRFPPIKDAY